MKPLELKWKFIYFLFIFTLIPSWLFAQCDLNGDTVVCQNEVVTYSSSTSGAIYDWNAYPGSVSGSGDTVTVSWDGSGTGYVSLVIKDSYGVVICTSTLSVVIADEPNPFILPSFIASCSNDTASKDGQERKDDDCLSVCDSTWVTYSVTPHAGSTYEWSISGMADTIWSTSNQIQVFWTGTGIGSVKVVETNADGCKGEDLLCVQVVASPDASFTTIPGDTVGTVTACLDQDIIFQNTSSPGDGSPLWSYTWVWGDGSSDVQDASSAGPMITHSYSSAGTYSVMLIAENECHCKDTAYILVEVLSAPAPDIECISTVCPGSSVTYNTNASCTSYNWSVTNGTIVGSSSDSEVTVTWGTSAPALLSLATSGCTPATCPVTNTVQIPVIPPVATIQGPDLICAFTCADYHISCDIPVDSIAWHFPGGITVNQDSINVHDIEACFYNPSFDIGTIVVEYYHFIPGSLNEISCGGTAELFIQQRPRLNLVGNPEICDQSTFNLYFNTSSASLEMNISNGSSVDTSFYIPATTNYSGPWTFGPGLFTITLTDTGDFYCTPSESISMLVHEIPPPAIGITGTDTVCPNNAYTYFGVATSSEYGLVWNAVNTAGSGTNVGPSYPLVWGAAGLYSLCVVQVDPITGCKSPAICDTVVSASPLPPPVIYGPDTTCNNGQVDYSASSIANDFNWTISPPVAGSVVAGQGGNNVTIEWNNWTGTATVSLTAYGCGNDSSVVTYSVFVIGTPSPALTLPATACEGAAVAMSSSTSGATFTWDFGDGSSPVTGNPVTHVYNAPGSHLVTLTATYTGSCSGSADISGTIMIYPKPDITISTPDPNLFCGPISNVNMFVASPVSGTSYVWYKSPSTVVSSGTSYTTNIIGSYYVTGTNTYGCTGISNIIAIDTMCDTACKPASGSFVSFSIQRMGCSTDSFSGVTSPGAINPGYSFDDPFGFPSGASGLNTSHTYTEPGYYRITFCADVPNSDGTGYCKMCRTLVDSILYIADFTDSIYCLAGTDSFGVQLINNTKILSTAPPPSYSWSINAGPTVSTATNPAVNLAAGTYNITLTVDGVCSITKTIVILGMPDASFTAEDSVCVNSPLGLTNTSTLADSTVFWDFGDGATSTIFNPVKVYTTAGNYTIKLLLTSPYGCSDSALQTVTVLPNTLIADFSFTSSTLCEGDSVVLTDATSGGYPGYDYVWSSAAVTPNFTAFYTGSYYLDVTDNKGCMDRSAAVDLLFHPTPKPQINAPDLICFGDWQQFQVNYPATGYTFVWTVNGSIISGWNYNFYTLINTAGNYTLTVEVTSANGCVGSDTIDVMIVDPPSATVNAASTLCEGEEHLLVGSSTSGIIAASYWSNGEVNDSIYVSTPAQYTYTVVDTFGCKSSAARTIHPLPDFCGLVTGCYEICDTIKELVWYAPKGYMAYQWLYNGSPISGATSDTLHVPLYQSGSYQVVIWTSFGCSDTSDVIDIQFISCKDCVMEAKPGIECGPVDAAGQQTYQFTVDVYNDFGPGAIVNLYTPGGYFTGISPSTIPMGWTTVTATFTDVPPADDTACITLTLTYENARCDTTFCIEIPDCHGDCQLSNKFQSIKCVGFDSYGNPMYLLCTDVTWGGSNGSTLTITTSEGTMSPSSGTVNNGINSLCFTFTDLPAYSNVALFNIYVFDPETNTICEDSFKAQFKPCPDTCTFGIYGLCAHCKDSTDAGQQYALELTVDNYLGSGATVTVLPISGGTFGAISPNPIPAGMQEITIPFVDEGPRDSIICFRVILELDGNTCWQDVCVYLPPCDHVGITDIKRITHFSVAPNPAKDRFTILHSSAYGSESIVTIYNSVGEQVKYVPLESGRSREDVMINDLAPGVYMVQLTSDGQNRGIIRLIVD